MTNLRLRISAVIAYEPSWSQEAGSALAIFLWSVAVFLTRDYTVTGAEWLVPSFGLIFGPLRCYLLLRLIYLPRVLMAMLGAFWWSVILTVWVHMWGWFPMIGPVAGVLCLDLFTIAKFSAPCLEELMAEYRGRRE